MPMSKEDFLNAVSDAFRRKNAGEDPESDSPKAGSRNNIDLPDPNIQVAPNKPDPEAVANSRIARAAPMPDKSAPWAPGAAVPPKAAQPSNLGGYNGVMPPASNGINPETGMPFYSPQQNQMSDDDKAKLQMKMQYLQNLQNTGGNSDQ